MDLLALHPERHLHGLKYAPDIILLVDISRWRGTEKWRRQHLLPAPAQERKTQACRAEAAYLHSTEDTSEMEDHLGLWTETARQYFGRTHVPAWVDVDWREGGVSMMNPVRGPKGIGKWHKPASTKFNRCLNCPIALGRKELHCSRMGGAYTAKMCHLPDFFLKLLDVYTAHLPIRFPLPFFLCLFSLPWPPPKQHHFFHFSCTHTILREYKI